MSVFGAFGASESSQSNFNPSWMGQTFNASSGAARPPPGRVTNTGGSIEAEEDRPMAAPIFMTNRYGREDLIALHMAGGFYPPDGLSRCPLYLEEHQPPCVTKPLTETEKKLRENINSSKAMSQLSAVERLQITGGAPDSPQSANRSTNPNGGGGWQHVPSKTWGRSTGTTPQRGPVRGAFSGGRGGGTEGGSSPYAAATAASGGMAAAAGGGSFPSRRGTNPVGRGGSTSAASSAFNSRAQGLYNPRDPSDRPRQRLRSTSEDADGANASNATNGWQQSARPAWGTREQKVPEWASEEDAAAGAGHVTVTRETQSTEGGSFDDHGRFSVGRSIPRQQSVPVVQQQQQQHVQQQQQAPVPMDPRRSPPQQSAWGTASDDRSAPIPVSSQPIDISGSAYSSQPAEMTGISPSTVFTNAYRQMQQQQQQQQLYAAPPPQPPKPATFYYLDPQKQERGPFSQEQMEQWYKMGYFQPTLEVRREQDPEWIALGELIKRNGTTTPFRYPEPVMQPPQASMPLFMEQQLGLGGAGGSAALWEQQAVYSRTQQTASYEALMEKQRLEEQARLMMEEREQFRRMQEMARQAESERERRDRELREKELEIQRFREEMARKEREMEDAKREAEERLAAERLKIEKERQEIDERQAEVRKREEAERRQREEEEIQRLEEERRIIEEEEARERARIQKEEKKREEEERRRAEAAAKAEAIRQSEAEAERERLATIAEAKKKALAASAPPSGGVMAPSTVGGAATMSYASGNTTPILPKTSGPAWGGAGLKTAPAASPSKKTSGGATLAEVMQEQERQAKAEQRELEKLRKEAEAALVKTKISSGGVWGGVPPPSVISTPAASAPSGAAWGGAGLVPVNAPAKPSPWAGPSLAAANKPKAAAVPAKPASAPAKKAVEKPVEKKKDDKKKASGTTPEATFRSWFVTRLQSLNDTVDADVLAAFIEDVTNPDEVEDYMVGYLGEGKQVKEFVREYIQKRSQLRNAQKDASGRGTTTAGSSSIASDEGFVSGGKKKQKKGAKFVVDSSCLGFRPTGNPNRVNQGEIDHPEPAPAGRR